MHATIKKTDTERNNQLVLIVEDEADIIELVSLHLEKAGYATKGFADAHTFFSFIAKKIPQLVILDLMLPDMDGFEVCKRLRKDEKYAHIPVMMLTARGDEVDRILGLELGADDYVTKPFSPRELVARVKAILRRHDRAEEKTKTIELGDLVTIDLEKYGVFVDGKKIEVTTTEFNILKLLASRKSYVFSREQILDYLWGHEKVVSDRTIDVHINNLRDKLGRAARFIVNIRGVGYKVDL